MSQEITLVTISQQMSGLSLQIGKIDGRLTKLESLSQQFVERFDQIDAWFEQIDVRFEQIDARFTKVESRLDRVERKLDSTFDAVGELKVQVTSIDDRLQATQDELRDFQTVISANNMKQDLAIQGLNRRVTVLER